MSAGWVETRIPAPSNHPISHPNWYATPRTQVGTCAQLTCQTLAWYSGIRGKRFALGAQNKQIALRLGVNVRTVARYRANIENKLNLHSRADLVRYAVDKGLVSAAP